MINNKTCLILLVISGLIACDNGTEPTPVNETNWTEIVGSTDWRVDEATTTKDGQSENVQNVQVSFSSDGQYTLLIPGIGSFGSNGTWSVNDQGTQITFNDGNQEIIAQSTITEDGSQMTLNFQIDNFKSQPISYTIVVIRNS